VSLYSIRSPSFGHLFPRERTLHLKVNLYMTEFTVQKGFPEGERQQFQHEDVQRDCQWRSSIRRVVIWLFMKLFNIKAGKHT